MSEEYINDESPSFSPFYPILILLIGLIGWTGYQVYVANGQRSMFSQQLQSALPTISQAQTVRDRYVALMKDLIQTSAKNPNAAQIVKEATAAGLLRVQQPAPGDASAAPSTEPAPTSTGT